MDAIPFGRSRRLVAAGAWGTTGSHPGKALRSLRAALQHGVAGFVCCSARDQRCWGMHFWLGAAGAGPREAFQQAVLGRRLTRWRGERTTRRRCGCRGCQEGLSPAQNPTLGRQGSRSARPPRKAKSSTAGTGALRCWVGCSALGGMWWRNGSGWAGRGCEPSTAAQNARRAVGLAHKRWVQCGGGAAHASDVAGCMNRGPCLSSKRNRVTLC